MHPPIESCRKFQDSSDATCINVQFLKRPPPMRLSVQKLASGATENLDLVGWLQNFLLILTILLYLTSDRGLS